MVTSAAISLRPSAGSFRLIQHTFKMLILPLATQKKKVMFNFITYFLSHPGGPFDLMSRRLIVASSRVIAERIAKEITEFHVGRDDAGD